MAPRQRPSAPSTTLDDSRSEASSTRERPAKGRKPPPLPTLPTLPTTDPIATDVKEDQDTASIDWSTMPLSVLHEYRYVYNLPCPSSFSSQINAILLSQGVGLRSATAISRQEQEEGGETLHRVSRGRVSKARLAAAVRKHFNNTAISEQDAIARFLYKVNEERRGKEFRLRFQP
ncbi:uncharacterized protein GIQ15_05911 [Arthroderma uncinatum]|uniref:uncharacterized protein n=1 Tax=Arthroderma uncinatum TaxID=74035 RepID=UPI00144AC9D5|nr:uncharacterized protein GIQ15_05911 [Arthroderma uncinatum]KAF3480564.1 hypothetical protein GIQ15_05911 [Arthroderma uncinatum]